MPTKDVLQQTSYKPSEPLPTGGPDLFDNHHINVSCYLYMSLIVCPVLIEIEGPEHASD
jgi:hypothetical protein